MEFIYKALLTAFSAFFSSSLISFLKSTNSNTTIININIIIPSMNMHSLQISFKVNTCKDIKYKANAAPIIEATKNIQYNLLLNLAIKKSKNKIAKHATPNHANLIPNKVPYIEFCTLKQLDPVLHR